MTSDGRRDFHHPYNPYDIQNDLMSAVYDCLKDSQIGIFESPTGTGKSLSLICSSLTWLRDQQSSEISAQDDPAEDDEEPAWVRDHAKVQRKSAAIEEKSALEDRLRAIRAKQNRHKNLSEQQQRPRKRFKPKTIEPSTHATDESQFVLDDYESDVEQDVSKVSQSVNDRGLSSANLELMEKLGLAFKPPAKDDAAPIDEIKIYFCSRTHSQLSQFVQEVRRVDLPRPPWAREIDASEKVTPDKKITIKHLPLGSRKNLCINSQVSRLGSAAAINDRCLELQQPDTPKAHKCVHLPRGESESMVNAFQDHTLAAIHDIEDLGDLGKELGICPYYASRASIKPSELVTLPYPLLLQKSAREALGLSVKGHVVIIDEAHNLMDSILSIHSISITLIQLKNCRTSLGIYLQKFRNRLKGKNRVYIAQLVRLLDSISTSLASKTDTRIGSDGIISVAELMAGKGADQINLYKLMQYLQESKLARKVEGYIQHEDQAAATESRSSGEKTRSSSMPVLNHVQSFLHTLTNPATEGRFFYERIDNGDLALKYMLLDPTYHFRDIVEDARAIVLAGGTMSPMDDYARHLFAYVDPGRLKTWSCGHIIPPENLIAMPVGTASDGTILEFTFEKRGSTRVLDALGESLISLAARVPDGMVVFFPSYAYLDQVVNRWKIASISSPSSQSQPENNKSTYASPSSPSSIWHRLASQKPIFQESKASTGSVEDALAAYSLSISSPNSRGGLLLSVIGGKLSEGINFSDALGRCVVVVGLPFPNTQSAQWKAKLEYIEQSAVKRGGHGKEASREFYENACMRAVNQCIGRAIRHQADYAAIVLMDRRYAGEGGRIQGKLPGWIKDGLVNDAKRFGEVEGRLSEFFGGKGRE